MKRLDLYSIGEKYGLVVLFVVVVIFFSVNSSTPQFWTAGNIVNVLGNQSILGIVAVATVIPLVAGQIDLSVGPSAGLCGVVTAGMMSKSHLPLALAIVIGIGVGVVIGTINGLLVSRVGINSIIATLGTSSIIAAVVLWYTKGLSIVSDISPGLTTFGGGKLFGIPTPFYLLAGVAVIVWYVLEQTPVGRYLTGVGINEKAAELAGLDVRNYVLASFLTAGFLAGVAGAMLVAYQGTGNPQVGTTFTLPALAAAFLGATTIKPGRYNVLGTLTAIFFLAASVNGLTFWGADAWVSELFNGVALLVAVGFSIFSGKRRKGHAAPPVEESGLDTA
jgi:ribose transport system permease protein